MKLGKLEKERDLRKVWKNEAYDFTNWLAEEENLNMLGDEIGLDIELITTEAQIGSFNADILAKEANTDNRIIIENQLESTDHDHLGKIITYGAGQDAKTIIWIVKNVRDEHRQAIDWLNENTNENINIFLCKIELWKIDDSNLAPKIQIISSPNNWSKAVKREINKENLSDTGLLQLEYWTELARYIEDNDFAINPRKPRAQHWYDFAIGSSLAHISLTVNTQKSEVRVQLWIDDSKDLFDYLEEQKEEIENELDVNLEWNRLDNSKASHISIVKNIDIKKEYNWNEAINWQTKTANKFYNAFSNRIKEYNK
ncbi:MAG: DUF4268 domain-containing protein [Methanobrevibacter sp.]|uniref:DUF4268 domain-containing protein n=1 Tax=Methanobrevibacter sp. TaxID=66852 RepID=UPI0026DFF0B1|nr:DUF4268 domain-containing protein [Methanobrevibacter sp.]MDO5849070.1 DUF4268 domain-containing protein [Methanobrevibacter sp.]